MRVALTIESFDPAKGGGETYARNFARALVRAGHELHVFANLLGAPEPGVAFHQVPLAPFKLYRRYVFATRVRDMLLRDRFDIIHGFGKSIHMDVYRPGGGVHRAWMEQEIRCAGQGFAGALARLKQSLSIDDHLVMQLERKQFGGGDGPLIIAVSRMVRDEMRRFYGTPAERIEVIYNGVDLEKYSPRNQLLHRKDARRELGLNERVALLFVGHNFARKGLAPAIRALPMLRHEGVPFRLIVLGAGKRGPYQELAQKLKCEGLVQFVGASREPERYYAAADVLVFPSYYDPCANVCLEALASGLPVVTSIYNGSGELITAGQEGFVVDPDNTHALGEAVSHFLDPEIRRQASVAARALAETRPASRNFQEVMRVYERALSRKYAAEGDFDEDD